MSKQQSWQEALKNAITDPQELWHELNLDPADLPAAYQANQLFGLRVPREFVARMEKGNPLDPLLLQVLPAAHELIASPGFSADPLNEKAFNPLPGLLHKYQSRVLLTLAGSCAINCRYCFRREFPYAENTPGQQGWQQALDYIAADVRINEVIFSGGEPLIVKDQLLAQLIAQIADIPHVTRIRIHTRLPIVIPSRINDELLAALTQSRLQIIVVIHCNHANEINADVINALAQLRNANIVLLNQSVLLKNINDQATTLINLSERLFSAGVLPYYLHLADRVNGTSHFEVDETTAQNLIAKISQHLPGYLVPKLVREIAGEAAKTILAYDLNHKLTA
jgi:EF-P beta-lysylation protein EpmB